MNHRSWLKWSLLLVSLALLIVSGTMVVRLLRQGEQEQQAFDNLATLVTPQPEAAEEPLELPTDLETLPEETPRHTQRSKNRTRTSTAGSPSMAPRSIIR